MIRPRYAVRFGGPLLRFKIINTGQALVIAGPKFFLVRWGY